MNVTVDWKLGVKHHSSSTIHMILIDLTFMPALILTQISIFKMNKICSLVTYVNMSLMTNLMKIYFHCTALIQTFCLCYMPISAALEQTW